MKSAEMNSIIKVENLQKKFGEFTAVDDLNFSIFENEIFGLLGPNGAGKTTTINMICGLLPQTSGSIVFGGGKDRKSMIGYCPQENIFYPKLTCFEQVVFAGLMYGVSTSVLKERAKQHLELLGLEDKMNVMALKLSGGMKRRLNICLAIIHDPEVLILDEPEAGLDPQSRLLVRDFIKKFGKEKTVVLTTHNMDEADRLADRLAIIDHGKLLLLDTPRNIKKSIGEGDILEICLENGNADLLAKQIRHISPDVKISDNSLFIKKNNVIECLGEVKKIADENGMKISEIRLRENTLEDVFIHLTGRNLRQ